MDVARDLRLHRESSGILVGRHDRGGGKIRRARDIHSPEGPRNLQGRLELPQRVGGVQLGAVERDGLGAVVLRARQRGGGTGWRGRPPARHGAS